MKKFLPINENPIVRNIGYHGFYNSIISSKDKICNEDTTIAELEIKDYVKSSWKTQIVGYKVVNNENSFDFFPNKWSLNMMSIFYKDCQNKDNVEIVINKQNYTNPYSSIDIFIMPAIEENDFELSPNRYRFGNFSKDGVFVTNSEYSKQNLFCKVTYPLKLTFEKNNNEVMFSYFCANGSDTIKLQSLFETEDLILGVSVDSKTCRYYEWLFSNYINFYYDKTSYLKANFLTLSSKDWRNFLSDENVNINVYTYEEILANNISILDFVKNQIKIDKYIETEVFDNKCNLYEDEENKLHFFLIYGFDEETKTFETLVYFQGKPKKQRISFEYFEKNICTQLDSIFATLKYVPCGEYYYLSKNKILQLYREYLEGKNISSFAPEYEARKCFFGLAALKEIVKKENIELVMNDFRISHLLMELFEINARRIEYLCAKGIILEKEMNDLAVLTKKQIDDINEIQLSIMYMKIKKTDKSKRIYELLQEIYECNKKFVQEIVEILQ